MSRQVFVHPFVFVAGLFVSLCALGVTPAYATDYRYGTVRWTRVLPDPSATEYKVTVTMQMGLQWSFEYGGTTASRCGLYPQLPPITSVTGNGACPDINSFVTLDGSIQFLDSTGSIAVPVKTNGASVTSTSLTHVGRVVEFNAEQDVMYTEFTFDVTYPKTQSPLLIRYDLPTRASTLRDGNNNLTVRLQTRINAATNTKSPISTSLPVIHVVTGVDNTVSMSSQAFDNQYTQWRLSTTEESLLQTASPSQFSLQNDGTITFKPDGIGDYAVQMYLQSYDNNNVLQNEVPLDVTFTAAPLDPNRTATLSTPFGEMIKWVNVGSQLIVQVSATLSPADSTYAGTITHSPLPSQPAAGQMGAATFSGGSGNGENVLTGTFVWTPNINSASTVVCFGVTYVKQSTGAVVTAQGQFCIAINVGALQTTLVAFPASGAAGGGPVTLAARLTRTADSAAVGIWPITFSFTNPDGSTRAATTYTDSTGLATATFITTKPLSVPYLAQFAGVPNDLLPSSATASLTVVKAATTSLDAPKVGNNPSPSIGFSLNATAVLNRHFTDGGLFGVEEQVQFTLTNPDGTTTTATSGLTDDHSVALATFPAPLATGDQYKVSAYFPGSDSLFGNVFSPTTTFTVGQRVRLSLDPVAAPAGAPVTLRARLLYFPQGSPSRNKA